MISAKEASELIGSIENDFNQDHLKQLQASLSAAIDRGVKEFSTYLQLSDTVITHLENLGYTVEMHTDYDRDSKYSKWYTIKF